MKFLWEQDIVKSFGDFKNGCILMHCGARVAVWCLLCSSFLLILKSSVFHTRLWHTLYHVMTVQCVMVGCWVAFCWSNWLWVRIFRWGPRQHHQKTSSLDDKGSTSCRVVDQLHAAAAVSTFLCGPPLGGCIMHYTGSLSCLSVRCPLLTQKRKSTQCSNFEEMLQTSEITRG